METASELRKNADRLGETGALLSSVHDKIRKMKRKHFGCLLSESGGGKGEALEGSRGIELALCHLRLAIDAIDCIAFPEADAAWARAAREERAAGVKHGN